MLDFLLSLSQDEVILDEFVLSKLRFGDTNPVRYNILWSLPNKQCNNILCCLKLILQILLPKNTTTMITRTVIHIGMKDLNIIMSWES